MMDLRLLSELMGGDQQLVDRFVAVFRTQVPDQVALLTELCDTEDWEKLSTALHSLKTQFNYVGMTKIAEQMRELEERVDSGQTDGIHLQIKDFAQEFQLFWQR